MDDLISRASEFLVKHGYWAGPVVGLLALQEILAIVGVLIPGTAILLSVGGLVGAAQDGSEGLSLLAPQP
jgi:membrane protein DedA with SNARE-associated domain